MRWKIKHAAVLLMTMRWLVHGLGRGGSLAEFQPRMPALYRGRRSRSTTARLKGHLEPISAFILHAISIDVSMFLLHIGNRWGFERGVADIGGLRRLCPQTCRRALVGVCKPRRSYRSLQLKAVSRAPSLLWSHARPTMRS